jgi:hypothetical protein
MKRRIAVVLNTPHHVETAISLYFSLKQSSHFEPHFVRLAGNRWGIADLLGRLGIREATEISLDSFHKAIIVTYPGPGIMLPQADHPIIRGFAGRRVLISHECSVAQQEFLDEPMLCLSPIGMSSGFEYLYQCENPLLEHVKELQSSQPVNFLVQGHLWADQRNFETLLNVADRITNERLRILFVGENAHRIVTNDTRVLRYSNLSEALFYSTCAMAHFVLPLIDPFILNGYYTRRFSSSFGMSFCSLKPLVMHSEFLRVYPVPSITYSSDAELLHALEKCLQMQSSQYFSMRERYQCLKADFRGHNQRVLEKYLM